jgi:hypothetical protein
MNKKQKFRSGPVRHFLEFLLANDYHSKRVTSLADATLGVLQSNSLGIHAIGHGLSYARGLTDKHAIKQVDRLLSNAGIELWDMFDLWVPAMIGERKEIIVALDWSDFDDDDQTMLMLSLTTKHGRATPLVWRTVIKSELKGQRQQHEAKVVLKFMEALPEGTRVTLLADRGFDDHKFMDFLHSLCEFDFVIRFRGGTVVESDKGEKRHAKDWVGRGGRARMLKNAKITKKGYEVATVVCMQDKQMKEPWCLASSRSKEDAKAFAKWYSKRWSIGVSRQGHIIQSVKVRPRLTDPGLVAWEAPWRESKTVKPSDNVLRKEDAQSTRLQHTVNADVASLHANPVAETVDNARKQQGPCETGLIRRLSPAGYQRRHGAKDYVSTGEALGVRRRKLVEEACPITMSGKWACRHQGVGSGNSTGDRRATKHARREGPGPVGTPFVQSEAGVR